MPDKMNFITLEGLQAFKEESESKSNGAYASKMTISQNATTGVVTFKLYAEDNTLLDTKTLDLDTEHIIKSVDLDYANKELIFTMADGSTIETDISALIDNLEDEITALAGRISTIENDYLTSSDKTELANDISAEETRAKGIENSLDSRVGAIEEDYLTSTDKSELNGAIQLRALTTETGNKIDLEINNTNFKIVAKLYDKNNTLLSTSDEIDLPLESVVVGGSYEPITKQVVLTLQNGTTIAFSVADLIYGLQSEITANNPLSSDLVSDTGNAHKFVTANEKAQITTNQNDIAGIKNGTDIDSFADVEDELGSKADKSTTYTKTEVDDLLDGKADTSDIPTALSQLTDDSTHRVVSDTEKAAWNGKQNAIADLESIRSGASAGATAVQDNNYVHTDNNYTTAEKQKLAGLSNYDDTEIKADIAELQAELSAEASTDITDTTLYKISGVADTLALPEKSQVEIVKIEGQSFVRNQYIATATVSQSANGISITSNNDGTYTIVVSNPTHYLQIPLISSFNIVAGKSYLVLGNDKSVNREVYFSASGISSGQKDYILTPSISTTADLQLYIGTNTPNGTYTVRPRLVDLTQFFGGNVPSGLTAEQFLQEYGAVIPSTQDLGTIIDTDTTELESCGINIWDEQWELGKIDYYSGQSVSSDTTIRSKNYMPIKASTTYYLKCIGSDNIRIFAYDSSKNYIGVLKSNNVWQPDLTGTVISPNNTTFIVPNNASYIRFFLTSSYGTTYNHDICINYSNASINGNYYSHTHDSVNVGSDVLRSAGSVRDSKVASGEIIRKVGVVDLGDLEWLYIASGYGSPYFLVNDFGTTYNAKLPSDNSSVFNGLCSKYVATSWNSMGAGLDNSICIIAGSGQLRIKNSNYTDATTFKTAMSGVMLYYELATPTTEQGTPFSSNALAVEMYGAEWQNGTTPLQVTKNYDISIKDQVLTNVEVDKNQQKQIEELAEAVSDKANTSDVNVADDKNFYNMGAYDTKSVSGGIVTITRQSWIIDLDSIQWNYNSQYNYWYYTIVDTDVTLPSSNTDVADILLAGYKNVADSNFTAQTGTITLNANGLLQIANGSSTEMPKGKLVYKKVNTYTEQVITNQPLNTLDQQGSEWNREEWEKQLNLLKDSSNITLHNDGLYFDVDFVNGQTYTFNIDGGTNTNAYALYIYDDTQSIQTITAGTLVNASWTFTCNVDGGVRLYVYCNDVNNANFMLNKGSHTYPYQPYNGKILHQKDIEPTLLWQNGSPNSEFSSTTLTISNLSNFKYLIFTYAQETGGVNLTQKVERANGSFKLFGVYFPDVLYYTRRTVTISSTSVAFADCMITETGEANSQLIPIAIYGTNIL